MNKNFLTRMLSFVLAAMMILTSLPINTFAETGEPNTGNTEKKTMNYDKTPIGKEQINGGLKVKVAKPGKGETAKELVENPDMPKLYTIRADYKVKRGDDLVINYQPYIVTVGDIDYTYTDQFGNKNMKVLTEEEKVKINKDINLPNLDGYTKPTEKYNVNYAFVKDPKGIKDFKDIKKNNERKYNKEFIYKPESNKIKIRHIFQHLYDRDKYGESKEGEAVNQKEKIKKDKLTEQEGLTGTSMKVQPLQGEDIKGYEPEVNAITTQVPENVADFELIFRYSRKKYALKYDTQDGTPIPTRTIYYEQTIPKLDVVEVPTKEGCEFQGWMPSVDLKDRSGKTYLKDKIIKDSKGNAIVDLSQSIFEKDKKGKVVIDENGKPKDTNSEDKALDLIMPASNVTFTAVWKDKEKADYAIQFWVEKADHDDKASLLGKYEFMGSRVYEQKDTGTRPNLDEETVNGLIFPDLDKARLAKIWNGDKFYASKYLYLNKFFVYNKKLTDEQNKDPKVPNMTKAVSATGKTVYNIYYDRQVYDLYFTKSNALAESGTFYPEIYVPDGDGGAKLAGGPGNPYHFKARFNQLMLGWPNDAMQTKGFDEGKQSYGWGPNYGVPEFPIHLDTPPYRLNADEFLDMAGYEDKGGYVSQIDKGDGSTIDVKNDPRYKDKPYKALSFGIKQEGGSMPHHMDFWMDGFKDGETIIRYDLYRSKADTNSLTYGHKYSRVQGFTPYGYTEGGNWPTIEEGSEKHGRVTEDDIDALNDERGGITPYPDKEYTDTFGFNNALGQMHFRAAFFNNADSFGDPLDGNSFDTNGYIRFKYKRKKYPLRFNYDPSVTRDDNYFNKTNKLDTFYEFPLKVLSPDLVADNLERDKKEYFKENPENFLDDPNKLYELGLYDLLQRDKKDPNKFFQDKDGNYRVKRPEGLSNQMEFKGWALDPDGNKLVWQQKGEKMPSHPVNLYAKWGEPDFKWKVTYDPNGGELPEIDPNTITTENKTIREGDIGKEKENTYPVKGYEAENEEASNVKEGNKVFTVIQRQKLADTVRPWREGYDFMGWEFVKYKKSADGKDTDVEDKTFFDTYGVPEIYTFGNDVVSNLYLRAIWVKNDLIDIMSYHHYINADYTEDEDNVKKQKLEKRRIDAFLGAVGSRQNTERLLVPKEEFDKLEENNTVYQKYIQLKDASGNSRSNTYNQYIRVKKENTVNSDGTITEIPENKKYNEFHFFYRPFRKREYTVNYLDERGKKEVDELFKNLNLEDIDSLVKTEEFKKAKPEDQEKIILEANENNKKKFEKNRSKLEDILKKYQVITPEKVVNGNRDYDARNYRRITGWKLTSAPQQQLFFNIGENNSLAGINGTGADQVFFYYKDVRVIEVPKDGKTPDGYVRVTFKAEKGGSFGKDEKGEEIKELHYDVIKGLISDRLPVPGEPTEESKKEEGKYYITPDDGKKFTKWDSKPLLNENTIIDNETKDFYVFTAKFDWSGLSASGLVRTEAFKDSNNNWTNDFAPKIEDLKKQLVWKEKEEVKNLPAGAVIKLYNEAGNELTKDDQVYALVNEKKKADTEELIRTVNIKAKVTFADNKEPQELDIPIKVYKNVYEALTGTEKPLFLSEAEKGELKDITGEYVKVTVNPTGEPNNKDSKVYYVNTKAWVDIAEIDINDDKAKLGFTHWSADKPAQNENGVFDFTKRHKFTEDTVITPGFSKDVIPQEGNTKPDGLPNDYVKVTFVPTDNATDETKANKVFWVNPNKEVTIPVTTPIGKNNFTFKEWKMGENAEGPVYNPNTLTKFAEATTITATYDEAENVIPYDLKDPITRPDGYIGITFASEEGITLKESKAYYVKKNAKDDNGVPLTLATIKNDTKKYGYPTLEANTGYEFTNWDPADITKIGEIDIVVTAKSKKLEDSIEKKDGVKKPDGYVEVKFVAGENGTLEGGEKIYYVNPNKYVTLDAPKPIANTGYSFGGWSQDASVPTVYKKDTKITANFNDLKDVVPKISEDTKMPSGYKTVTFVIEPAKGGEIVKGETKIFFVNPNNKVTLDPPATKAETGYEFDKWDQDATKPTKYADDTTIKGKFKTLGDIIPKGDGANEKAKPNGYVTVKFVKGEHGTEITGETVYYVNPKANKKLSDINTKPTVKAETGWDFTEWDKENTTAIDKDITVTAQYAPLPDVDTKVHPGYITVKFSTEANGFIKGSTTVTEKTVYVNPYKAVALDKFAPEVEANTGFTFAGWDTQIEREINYKGGDVIRAKYNAVGDVIPKTKDDESEKKSGYVTVTFNEGAHGTLSGTKVYYVNPNKIVTVPAPQVTADVGYKQKHGDEAWDQALVQQFKNDTKITAQYTELDPIVTGDQAKPEGYNTVIFKADANGTVSGTLKYYVNPNKEVDLSGHADSSITKTANTGYTVEGGKWTNRDNFALKAKFNKDTEFIYNFQKIKDIIPVDENTERPDGYVLVTFKADENGKLEGGKEEIKYYVNPKAGIKLVEGKAASANELAVPKTIPDTNNDFYAWYEPIDTFNTIVSDRTYVAKFTTSQVELSYDANKGTGTVPESVKVPYGTKVRLASAPKLKKENSKLIGWNIGGKIYNIGDAIVLKENTKAVAEWKLDTYIIKYDPEDPKGRPDDSYIRISFEADEGLELSNVKYYYVKKGVNINLNNVEIERPVINTKVGFKSLGWDKSKTGVIPVGDKDIVIRATSKPLSNVVPAKDSSGNPQDKPTGYVEVKFVAAENGEIRENNIKVDGKVYYVNPNNYIVLTPPSTQGNIGYTFASWDKDATIPTKYESATTITASFNQIGDVIPKTRDDDSEKPEGYATVKFVIKPTEGGKIVNKETTIYYVDPNRAVTINPPLTQAEIGYIFKAWDKDTTSKAKNYTGETIVKGSFKKIDEIIPSEDSSGKKNAQPNGYVKVVFDKGEDGKSLEGQKVYYVNPNAGKTLAEISHPTVTAKTGYKFTGWDTTEDTVIDKYYMVIAKYDKLEDVIPQIKDDGSKNEKPAGYIEVKFVTTENGTIKDTNLKEKVLFVNRNKAVVLEGYAPEVTADNLHTFADWDTSIRKAIQYNDGDEITALYNAKDNIYKEEKPGYVKVEFLAGEHGKLSEKKYYWVKPGVPVTVPAPKVTANTGYEFKDWDKNTTVLLNANDKTYQITAVYDAVADVIPGDLNKPNEYKTVTFKAENGTLSGTNVFYVNPKKEVDLSNEAYNLIKHPNFGYTEEGAEWDKSITGKKYENDETYIFKFKELSNVDVKYHPGYVKVEFVAGDNGSIVGGNKTYYVNPEKKVKVGSDELPVPNTIAVSNYEFYKWIPSFEGSEEIIGYRKFVAIFKAKTVTLTYDLNGGKGTAPGNVIMPFDSKINLASSSGISNDYNRFMGWRIDGKIYKPGDDYVLKGDVTAYAVWEEEQNIIPYNPDNPITKPEGYVRVKFEAEEGLELVNPQYCYVRKGIGVNLGNNSIVKPAVKAKTGYEFKEWDKPDTLLINDDIVVTAKSKKLDDVIDSEKGNKPEGYVTVEFVAKINGRIKNGKNIFYVNPNKYVTLEEPEVVLRRGFAFGSWSQDAKIPTVYEKDTRIIASFNKLDDVVPKTKDDDSEKPSGYYTVTFKISGKGGQLGNKETYIYYVNPDKEVSINPPKTHADVGYEFDEWNIDTTKAEKYKTDTDVIGNFKPIKAIIPSKDANGDENPKPDGYVTVTFLAGDNGKLEGETVYYVNPKANPVKTLGNIYHPTVTAETGYKFTKWDTDDTKEIKENIVVKALYEAIDDVIVKTTNDESEKPQGYIAVTFKTTDKGGNVEKTVYINPNKAVVLKDKAPDVNPVAGYSFARWDKSIDQAIQYKDGEVITALYNNPGDVSETKVGGYVEVEFKTDDHGTLDGKTKLWIKPDTEVDLKAPGVKPEVGYKFDGWDKGLTVKANLRDGKIEITAKYKEEETIIPEKDVSEPPNGYVEVVFEAVNGSIAGNTRYYVNPNKEADFNNIVKGLDMSPNFAYTAKGASWNSTEFKKTFTAGTTTFKYTFEPLASVIPAEENGKNVEEPNGYVKVTLIPTDKAKDNANIVYYVNPTENVDLKNLVPEGKEWVDSYIKYTNKFKGWTVTRGTVNSWKDNISGKFIQDTEITAIYETLKDTSKVPNKPEPKDDVVTPIGDVPKAEDLIKNIPGTSDKPLPNGTTFKYKDGKNPDLSKPGKTTVEVEVTYPGGVTTIVEVPITVVDNVVPQFGNEKPNVPGNYVKVTVDTTDKATDNTKFKKVFWVKPDVEVTLYVLAPTGKEFTEDGVTHDNKFLRWESDTSKNVYTDEINDTFTRNTIITAVYEYEKNVEPKAKDDQWIPQGFTPKAKDFIKNPYDDDDSNNKDNLPPGTRFEFVPGAEPDTQTPGTNKTTRIKVTYPNGEVKEVPVQYNVTGDVVEQIGDERPVVPDKFVKVTVDTTDIATRETYSFKTYWVNPDRMVKIPTDKPKGVKDDKDNREWLFDYWQADSKTGEGTRYREVIEDRFTEDTDIKAFYYKADIPDSDYVVTDVNVFPNEDEYRSKITPPAGKDIDHVRIIAQPDVSRPGNRTQAEIEVFYTDGTSATVKVKVYVQRPGETNTRIVYRDRIVEKEKIVEKIIKIKDNQRLKEVRFMQGFEGKFRPHDGLTRAEAAQILANALKQDGYKYNPAYPINYKDVKQKWYTQAIVITTQANVFKGYDDGYFRPEEKISRAEWIATLKRFQQLKDADGNKMGLKANHWATREVEAAYEEGWLQIYTNGNAKFNANEPITREEVAAVTNKAFGRLIDRTYITRNDKSVINYKDINPSMWSYVDILCASNSFIRDENFYMSHGIEYINSMTNSIEGTIIFNVQLKNLEIIQDKFQRYLR